MTKNIKKIIKNYIYNFQELFHREKKHYYRDFYIKLPSFHLLPLYQRQHLKYDRFLPRLAEKICPNNTVIDVGANCGDTLAGMVESNPSLQYICVEPNELFYNLLTSNIELIKAKYKHLDVVTIKHLIGKDVASASLYGTGGTKSANSCGSQINSRTLDDIVAEINARNIILLKSDVDGFDYDIINSARGIVRSHMPIIFFECEYALAHQKTGFTKTIEWLNSIGYQNWVLFDNFGEIVLRTKSIDQVIQLINYVWKQNIKLTTRTIYYFDILVFSEKHRELVDSVVLEYLDYSLE